jgi:hypothetical protein
MRQNKRTHQTLLSSHFDVTATQSMTSEGYSCQQNEEKYLTYTRAFCGTTSILTGTSAELE